MTGLNTEDVDLSRNQVLIRGKEDKERIVPFGSKAKQALEGHLEQRASLFSDKSDADAKKALFLSASGKRIYARAVQRLVKHYLSLCSEVTQKSPHTLRHSFATHLLDEGAGIRVIKELMGHSTLGATQIYTGTSIEHLKSVWE